MAAYGIHVKKKEKNDIENDHRAIEILILSAKNGNWGEVWLILGSPDKPERGHFFNVIPENRRWGVLHQSCYWNDVSIVTKLLRYSACDSGTLTKTCRSECGDTSRKTAAMIAEQYGYSDIQKKLEEHKNSITDQQLTTFVRYESYTHTGCLSLITLTLAAYKKTFHPRVIDKNKSIIEILQDIFNDIMHSEQRWKEVMDKVCDSVYVVCEENYKKIIEAKTRDEFFRSIIDTYTVEQNYMYAYLNTAFRRQRQTNYKPTGHDLAIGPYAVMYQMLLLFWNELPRESGTTFRKMLMIKTDANQYQRGTTFVWPSIVSSSVVEEKAQVFPTCGPEGEQDVFFTIDNSAVSDWRPRDIEKFARYKENERTYPAGAKFMVTERSMNGAMVCISLKLLQNY